MNYLPLLESIVCRVHRYEAAMRGRPKAELVLTDDEHEQLVALTLRRKTAQALAQRARIVLACAEGIDNKSVASRQWVTQQTVSRCCP